MAGYFLLRAVLLCACLGMLLGVSASLPKAAVAELVSIGASRDNTLYESALGDVSAGQGTGLYVGRNNQPNHFRRRALVAFDVAGAIPSDAIIESASLTLAVTKVNSGAGETPVADVSLHRALRGWGEAESGAGQATGGGAPAEAGDATWLHAHFADDLWNAPGGDFTEAASGSIDLVGVDSYEVASTPELIADVQAWLLAPETNFGWLLRSSELTPGSAKVIASREYEDVHLRPRLVVSYSVPKPGDTNADGQVDLEDLNNVRNHFGEIGSPAMGDTAPFDGTVDLTDLNNVRNHFGASAARNAPEPSTIVLVSVALACIVARRKGASVT